MGKGSKKLYWACAGAAFLLSLLIALAVIAPKAIDSDWLKEIIQTEVQKQFEGDLNFQKANLTILPSPSIALQQVSLSIHETAQVKLETITVYPKLLPILTGSIELNKIVIDKPDVSLLLPERQAAEQKPAEDLSVSAALTNVFTKLTPILKAIPGLEAGMHNGILRLHSGEKQIFLFEDVNGSFAVSPKSLTTNISCRSNIWESMELKANLNSDSQEGKSEILLKNTNNKIVADYILQGESPIESGSFSTLQVNFTFSPKTGLTADIKSSGSSFTALHEDKKITAKVGNIKGSIRHTDELSSLTVEDLTLIYPQVRLSGSFNFDRTIPHVNLDIKTQNSDIRSVYEVLPVFLNALYGDLPVVQGIFDITRGGTITESSLHIEGKSLPDLAVFESMLIQGQIENADVSLFNRDLNLQGVTGEISIVNGIFEGRNVQARLGNTTGTNGSLKLGLIKKEITPFHLDLELDADLSEVPPLVKKLLPNENVQHYISLIERYEGKAQGRLTLGESLESITARVEAHAINLLAKLKPVPYLITVDGGRIIYDGVSTESHDLQGTIGKSTFSNYSSRINLEGETTITVESGSFHVVLDEIYPWLSSYEKLKEELEDIKNITGIADITINSIKGHFFKPGQLQYDVQGSLKNITLATTKLPGPLKVKSGQAHIIPDKITFENLQGGLLDSSLTYSGVLQNFINGTTNATVIITDATIGQELNTWFVDHINTLKKYNFRTPLLISRSNVKWIREELIDLQGDFSIKNGPIFSIDIMLAPDELLLRNLSFKNNDERASITLDLKKRELEAAFQGNLSKKTITAIIVHKELFPDAWRVKGDISFHFDMDSLAKATANGKLDGSGFLLPLELDKPLLLKNFSLSASDKTLTLNSAEAVFENMGFAIDGKADLSEERLSMDFDVITDTIEVDKILAALKEEGDEEPKEEEAEEGKIEVKQLDLAYDATINLHADSLKFKKNTWEPFESKIVSANSYLGIEVLEAELCQISTPGKISFHEGRLSLDFLMEAEDQEFSEVLICLEGGEQQMTGTLNLKAGISGSGTKDTIVNSLQGNLQFSAKEGFIYQDAHAAKLLNFLNLTNLFQGKIPDLRTAGFHYDSLVVKGTMENSVLLIAPAKLDAPILEIAAHGMIDIPKEKVNLQVLVAPIKVLNKIQRYLPIIRRIIPSNLIAVPVEVSGDFSDIQVRAMSMAAIGTRAFGVMFDAFSTPVRVIEEEPK